MDDDSFFIKLELITNFRQKEDLEYHSILNELSFHGLTERVKQFIDDRTNIYVPVGAVYLAYLNADVNEYNAHFDKFKAGTLIRGVNNRIQGQTLNKIAINLRGRGAGVIPEKEEQKLTFNSIGTNSIIYNIEGMNIYEQIRELFFKAGINEKRWKKIEWMAKNNRPYHCF